MAVTVNMLVKVIIAWVLMVLTVLFAATVVSVGLGHGAEFIFARSGDSAIGKMLVIVYLIIATFGIGWVSWYFRNVLCPCKICPWVCEEKE